MQEPEVPERLAIDCNSAASQRKLNSRCTAFRAAGHSLCLRQSPTAIMPPSAPAHGAGGAASCRLALISSCKSSARRRPTRCAPGGPRGQGHRAQRCADEPHRAAATHVRRRRPERRAGFSSENSTSPRRRGSLPRQSPARRSFPPKMQVILYRDPCSTVPAVERSQIFDTAFVAHQFAKDH